jgi:hypothetical protein
VIFKEHFSKTIYMKRLPNYANFPKRHWRSEAQFLLVKRIQKAASTVIKHFPKAVSAHINSFFKAAGADNFSQIFW